jgi:hypothetical protein
MRKDGKPISTTTDYKTSLSQAYNKHAKAPINQAISPYSPATHPYNKTPQQSTSLHPPHDRSQGTDHPQPPQHQ